MAGYFYDKGKVTTSVSSEIETLMGKAAADDVISILKKVSEQKGTVVSSILSVLTLLIGATGVFVQLQKFLNVIWEVPPAKKRKFLRSLKERVFSFGLILAVGFLLLISLLLSSILSALSFWVTHHFSESLKVVFKILDIMVSFSIITLLFGAIYKFLPEAKISWKDVWVGAVITSILFVAAKFALGVYFGHSKPESAYGAAGSIVLLMLWVSYSSIIVLFGAEFTHTTSFSRNGKIDKNEVLESH